MFHPDLVSRAGRLPRGVARPWALPLLRAVPRLLAALGGRGGEVVSVGDGQVFLHRPKATPAPALLWIHGGGLVLGDPRQDDTFLQRFAEELGVFAAAPRYRLAPEHPYPAALDDLEAAFRWLAERPEVDASRIVVGGASAGGGLAAALCQRLGARGGPRPSFQLLVYPMLDDRSATGEGPTDAWFRLWDRRSNALGWDSYLRGHDRAAPPPFAVPARTEDLSGLPPAWIGVGTLDLFHDEDVGYAARLRAAGIAVDLEVVEGAYHGFDAADPGAPVSRRFRDAQVAAVARHLRPR